MLRERFKISRTYSGLMEMRCWGCREGIMENGQTESNLVLTALYSPYASLKLNQRLERDLQRVYARYYFKSLISNSALFWKKGGARLDSK